MKKLIIPIAAILILGGCRTDKAMEPFRDAPIDRRDDSPANVINMPDGFSNIATKCDPFTKGIRIYTTMNTNGRAVTAVADPNCK